MTETNRKPRAVKIPKAVTRAILRTLLVVFTLVLLVLFGLIMVLDHAFNGPSMTARELLTMSMLESSGMKWTPAIFIGEDTVEAIKEKVSKPLPDEPVDTNMITINKDTIGQEDAWKDYPDGIKIEDLKSDTFNAHVMLVRDPSAVYMAVSNRNFSKSVPGKRMDSMMESEKAIAGINGGAFFDNGTTSSEVGSVPMGLVVSQGEVVWDDGSSYNGFVGFDENNILVVANKISAKQVKELKIRDGCCFGPVLIMNGQINDQAYNTNSGLNPRTAIGQRSDGTVIMLCIDGRQAGSLGGSYADVIDIMVEYGAVNACLLDGGSSSVMFYRDNYGRFGDVGTVVRINSYSLLQSRPRLMPTFFMVRPGSEG